MRLASGHVSKVAEAGLEVGPMQLAPPTQLLAAVGEPSPGLPISALPSQQHTCRVANSTVHGIVYTRCHRAQVRGCRSDCGPCYGFGPGWGAGLFRNSPRHPASNPSSPPCSQHSVILDSCPQLPSLSQGRKVLSYYPHSPSYLASVALPSPTGTQRPLLP